MPLGPLRRRLPSSCTALLVVACAFHGACTVTELPVGPPASLPIVPCTLSEDDPNREPFETRCDGIDNDCDGLVDVLAPVPANGCTAENSCVPGYAVCENGVKVCRANGPAPEVLDGIDNDCNGTVDDVEAAEARSRVLVIVPSYLAEEAPEEIADVTSMLEQRGLAYDIAPADWASALPSHALAVFPGYLLGTEIDDAHRRALESFAQAGGIVIVTKPIAQESSPNALVLAGVSDSVKHVDDLKTMLFDGDPVFATRVFDSPEERSIPLTGEAFVLTPKEGTAAVAHDEHGGVLITRRAIGKGAIYALGRDLFSFGHTRCYVNCFEPSGDLAGLFFREALREATHGHLVMKHTVPGPESSIFMLTHDVDAPDAHKSGAAWGEPGALQLSRLEKAHGARGTFLVTTDYVTPYYNEDMVKQLCVDGMCPISAHSVLHADNFQTQPKGTCDETFATYQFARATTLCGEVRVSLELLEEATGGPVKAWRSPYLYVHPNLYDVLESVGVLADSSWAVGDLKYNLPISLARTGINQATFHKRALYTLPIAIEDGIGGSENGVETRIEMRQDNARWFVTTWVNASLRNADNDSFTVALIHPSYGRGVPQDNLRYKLYVGDKVLSALESRSVRTNMTMGEVAEFWRAREATSFDARYAGGQYAGSLHTGAFPVSGLTLEFGDAIKSFDCASCGATTISGRRVTIASLPADTEHAFTAVPGL